MRCGRLCRKAARHCNRRQGVASSPRLVGNFANQVVASDKLDDALTPCRLAQGRWLRHVVTVDQVVLQPEKLVEGPEGACLRS